jgi:CRISP-associated protein Cas1
MNGTLYLDRKNLALSLQSQALRIHHDGKLERTIPLSLIERIVLRASVDLSSSLLANLAHQGIGVTLYGGRHGKYSTHLGVSGTRDVSRRLAQYALYMDPKRRLDWSSRLVAHKLLRQIRLLQNARNRRPDLRRDMTHGLDQLGQHHRKLQDEPPLNIDSLRGIEGSASRIYFKAFVCLFPASLDFNRRERRPPPDPVNALLSLGYTLLHGDMQKAVETVGLDPWLGIYHEPAHGRPSLVCDLVEPYRACIDKVVWSLIRNRILRDDHFNRDGDACLLNKNGRSIFYPIYESHLKALRPVFRRVVHKVAISMNCHDD